MQREEARILADLNRIQRPAPAAEAPAPTPAAAPTPAPVPAPPAPEAAAAPSVPEAAPPPAEAPPTAPTAQAYPTVPKPEKITRAVRLHEAFAPLVSAMHNLGMKVQDAEQLAAKAIRESPQAGFEDLFRLAMREQGETPEPTAPPAAASAPAAAETPAVPPPVRAPEAPPQQPAGMLDARAREIERLGLFGGRGRGGGVCVPDGAPDAPPGTRHPVPRHPAGLPGEPAGSAGRPPACTSSPTARRTRTHRAGQHHPAVGAASGAQDG